MLDTIDSAIRETLLDPTLDRSPMDGALSLSRAHDLDELGAAYASAVDSAKDRETLRQFRSMYFNAARRLAWGDSLDS